MKPADCAKKLPTVSFPFYKFPFDSDTHLLPAAVVAAGQGRRCGGAAAALQGPDVSRNIHIP